MSNRRVTSPRLYRRHSFHLLSIEGSVQRDESPVLCPCAGVVSKRTAESLLCMGRGGLLIPLSPSGPPSGSINSQQLDVELECAAVRLNVGLF